MTKKRQPTIAVVLLAFLVMASSACASLPLKERATVSLNASEIALEGSHNAERRFCSPNADQTQTITHCDGLAASAIGLTDAKHQALARIYSRAFAAQIVAAQALLAWRAGDPAPVSLTQYQAVILEIIAEVTKIWPSAHDVVSKAQLAKTDAEQTVRMMGGAR